jgi:hypothetical protein
MTTASGTATSILAPATAGAYKLFVIDVTGNYSSPSTATLTVDNTTLPVTTIQSASSTTTTTATLNGNITATGGTNPTVRGFNYGTTSSYGTDTTESGSFSTGAYTANITGLTCNTTYHARSYATNTAGTGTSSDYTFTTSPCPVTVSSSNGGGGLLAYIQSQQIPNNPVPQNNPTQTNNNTQPSSLIVLQRLIADMTRTLRRFTKGKDVETLQQFLILQDKGPTARALARSGVDANFGKLTRGALIEWQSLNNLVPDGVLGGRTRARILSL